MAHCYEQTTFSEFDVTDYDYLRAFRNMKNKVSDIRNSADVAALFVAYHDTLCGQGYAGEWRDIIKFINQK